MDPQRLRIAFAICMASLCPLLLAGCGKSTSPQDAEGCASDHWVSAWQAPPSDAITPFDASLTVLLSGPAQTFRLVFSPLGQGSMVRVHLSNRFGLTPVVFDAVRIAHQTSGAAIDPQTSMPVLFDGQANVTIPAGKDVVSDPTAFSFASLDNVAVSIAAADPTVLPTHHFTARQTSYATAPGAGDHSNDASSAAFTQSTTTRPFVIGLDTLAPAATSTVVTAGDSLTDGFQGPPTLLPQNTATINLNERYPDYLRQQIEAAGRGGQLYVGNAGISGNRVLENGQLPPYGPSLEGRLQADVLAQAGITDVILYEGINDIDQTEGLTAQQLTDGYVQMIAQMHQQGLNVIQATLTPNSGNTASQQALWTAVNTWIRTQSPADAIADFDAAVHDPSNPAVLAPQYDGGDGLHLSAAGYQALAQAVNLADIHGAACGNP